MLTYQTITHSTPLPILRQLVQRKCILFIILPLLLNQLHLIESEISVLSHFPTNPTQYSINATLPAVNWDDYYENFQQAIHSNNNNINNYNSENLVQKISFDPIKPGTLYVSVTNNIFILDSNLSIKGRLITGPIWDNELCISAENLSNKPFYTTSNFITHSSYKQQCLRNNNTILVSDALSDHHNYLLAPFTDQNGQRLVVCGSFRRGSCYFYEVKDFFVIQKDRKHVYDFRENNFLAEENSLAFVGSLAGGDLKLWTFGSRKEKNSQEIWKNSYQKQLGLSLRNVPEGWKEDGVRLMPILNDDSIYYSQYRGIFEHDNFLYYISFFPYINFYIPSPKSFINSLCMADQTLSSAVQTELKCDGIVGEVVASGRLTAGELLAKGNFNLNCNDNRKIIQIDPGDEMVATIFKSKGTYSVCLYPLKTIREVQLNASRLCLRNKGNLNQQFVKSESCEFNNKEGVIEVVCILNAFI